MSSMYGGKEESSANRVLAFKSQGYHLEQISPCLSASLSSSVKCAGLKTIFALQGLEEV